MIKIDKFTSSTGLTRLEKILDQRRNSLSKNIPIVSKIIKGDRKNKNRAVIKYERKFSNNTKIKTLKKKK